MPTQGWTGAPGRWPGAPAVKPGVAVPFSAADDMVAVAAPPLQRNSTADLDCCSQLLAPAFSWSHLVAPGRTWSYLLAPGRTCSHHRRNPSRSGGTMARGRNPAPRRQAGRTRSTLGHAYLLRPLHGACLQRAVPHQHGEGAERFVGGLRPSHPDGLRPRRAPSEGRGRQGRRPRGPPRPYVGAHGGDSARPDEHIHDHKRHRRLAASPLRRRGRQHRRRALPSRRHDPERHRQGIPFPGHLHISA